METIRIINLAETDSADYPVQLADCVILTKERKILMQKRPENWGSSPGALNIFGGHVDDGETIMEALVRELHEEVGAIVNPDDVAFIGALTEAFTGHQEIVHVHFWHDKNGTITGCYEAEAREFETAEQALAHPKIMDYAVWALKECRNRNLIK